MNVKKSLLLACLAGAACVPAALAGPEVENNVKLAGDIDLRGGYQTRATAEVYDNFTNTSVTIRGGFARSRTADDFNFAPGPWSATQGTTSGIGFAIGTGAFAPAQTVIVKIDFFDNFVPTALAGANVYQGTLLGTYNSGPIDLPANTLSGGVFFRINDAFAATFTDASGAFVQETQDANGVRYPEPLAATAANLVILNGLIVGSSDANLYRDTNADGFISGTGTTDVRVGTGTPLREGLILQLSADFATPPPATVAVLAPADGLTTQTGSTNGAGSVGGVAWYQIDVGGVGALDSALTFLDMDSEGSAGDVDFALYNANGDIVSIDTNGGSGSNAQFSYGTGRRAAVGDGRQYDGRHFDQTTGGTNEGLNAGTFFLAVAPAGSTFSGSFSVTAGATPAAYTLRINTNVNAAGAFTSVPPQAIDVGNISGPIVNFPAVTLGRFEDGLQWWQFTLCQDVTDASGLFLDINAELADDLAHEWFVFDSNGNLFAADGLSGPGNRPQLSFGAVSPERAASGDGSGLPFAGQDGDIPPGTYYLGVAYDGFSAVPAITTEGRFHLRNVGGSDGFTFSALGQPSFTDSGCVAVCDPDLNQDGNADQGDVDYIINVIAGGDNPTGIDPDFNRDGNSDQGDIDALVNVIAGGACP